jgi:alpha-methylacyl-CoA racemase
VTWNAYRRGPLRHIRVVEMGAIGPTPFAAMMLADMGAEVIRVDRAAAARSSSERPHMARGRRSIALDLKQEAGVALLLQMVAEADVLIEGFRPGVMERLGVGPEECAERNPTLVYGRMTGWGQRGPHATEAGHDINYISLAGVLGSIGRPGTGPVVPLNLVGDFGGGGMLLLAGVLMALVERSGSGRGQVVDAAMVDGAGILMTLIHEFAAEGNWSAGLGSNLLDGGAPYYDVYETSDGRHMAVGALEPQFFAKLIEVLGIEFAPEAQEDRSAWPRLRSALAAAFSQRTRDEWTEAFSGVDACVSPVLDLSEAATHPQAVARGSYVEVDGRVMPAPAPLFSRTPGALDGGSRRAGDDTEQILAELGMDQARVADLLRSGVAVQAAASESTTDGVR